MPLFSWQSRFAAGLVLAHHATAFTGSEYSLTHEYSGVNFFDGWDFYSGRDPTGGFVTYYSRSSAELTDLIRTSADGPAYMGVNYVDKLPFDQASGRGNGAGRPSVRIASKQAFTHGLFIGDFAHIPAGVCGTWPAFWTLGPNWPYTGEVDILEGVNANMNNVMSLHTNETCIIEGDMTTMTGSLENTNCAYYPDYNVGCGVKDDRTTSFGVGFNQGGGGVYAMQWTSEYINIWHWPRSEVPNDVDSKTPDPGSWGLPAAQLGVGNCTIDQHFQSHKIIFDTTFCGEYAGNPYVWKTDDANSCEASTGLATCDNYVANNPEAFKEAYWDVNYVRVYQLVDPEGAPPSATYIASEQPPKTVSSASYAVATPNLDTDSLCPQYNFQIVTDGKYQYEIACDFDPPGPDIIGDPYDGFKANSLADCIAGCTYMNENNGTNFCGAVTHLASINFCYFKKYIDGTPQYRKGYNEIRLIYYGYPQITDDPNSSADSTATSVFVETIPTPQTYRPLTTTPMVTTTSMASSSTVMTSESGGTTLPPAMGDNSTSTSTLPPDYSETVTSGYENATSTTSSSPSTVTSIDPGTTRSEFLIAVNVPSARKRLVKRAVQYLAFDDEGKSILVTSEDEAARFYLDSDGSVKSGTQFVNVDSTSETPEFSLQDAKPEEPVNVEVDPSGSVRVQGYDGFCLTPNGSLVVVEDQNNKPSECISVDPGLVPAPSETTTTTSGTSSSTSSSGTGTSSVSTTSTGSMASSSASSSNTVSMSSPSASTTNTNSMASTSATSSGSSSESTSQSRSSTSNTLTDVTGSTSTRTSTNQQSSGSSTSSQSGSSTSSSTSSTPTAPLVNGFVYSGCFGIPQDFGTLTGISLPLTDPAMNNDKCTSYCQELNAYYAGTHDTQCFCGTNMQLYDALLSYPDAQCNTPCPGSNRDICGGTVMFDEGSISTSSVGPTKHKRKADIILVSLYNNTELLPQPGDSNVPTTSSATSTGTITTSSTVTGGPISFPPDQVSYNVTGTNTATVISTTYVDVCPVCPGGLTTRSTTITVPHCGCTASYDAHLQTTVPVPSPSVPMITTVKDCACGHQGAQSTITVTVPHSSSISQLAAMVTQQGAPGAAAGAGAMASASAAASASASAVAGSNAPAAAGGAGTGAGSNAPAVAAGSSNPSGVAGTGAPPMGEEETSGPAPMNMVQPVDVSAALPANGASAAASNVVTTPHETPGATGAAAPPAPASPPTVAENSALTNPHAVVNPVNGAGSNATLPLGVQPISNGSFAAPNLPVQSYKSAASRLMGLGGAAGSFWIESRYLLSLLVGAFLAGVVSAW